MLFLYSKAYFFLRVLIHYPLQLPPVVNSKNKRTKTYNKELYRVSSPFPSINYVHAKYTIFGQSKKYLTDCTE